MNECYVPYKMLVTIKGHIILPHYTVKTEEASQT